MLSQYAQGLPQQLNFLLKIGYNKRIVNLFSNMPHATILIPVTLFILHFVKHEHGFAEHDGHGDEHVEYAAGQVGDETD